MDSYLFIVGGKFLLYKQSNLFRFFCIRHCSLADKRGSCTGGVVSMRIPLLFFTPLNANPMLTYLLYYIDFEALQYYKIL